MLLTSRASERMAIDAVEGEQQLLYSASRQEHLSRLLNMEWVLTNPLLEKKSSQESGTPTITSLPQTTATSSPEPITKASNTHSQKRKRTPTASSNKTVNKDDTTVASTSNAPTVKKGRKKATSAKNEEIVLSPPSGDSNRTNSTNVEPDSIDVSSTKKLEFRLNANPTCERAASLRVRQMEKRKNRQAAENKLAKNLS